MNIIAERISLSGRWECRCLDCGHLFWFLPHEIGLWEYCPHCVGWSTFNPMRKLTYADVDDDDGDPC